MLGNIVECFKPRLHGRLFAAIFLLSDENECISYKCSSFVYSHNNILR